MADGLNDDILKLLSMLSGHPARSDALVEACVACLEAAQCLAGLVAGGIPITTDRQGEDAVHAIRAASLAVRSALVEADDERRTQLAD
ncbi:hypothetical protein L3Q67_32305 [Saccharothrix sp. AJ9571]|nr:hypothetical protein L3Q67_32305 [Saccharothrix sp. AJ9571]